ncbi:TRAP transporter substrate-binding protein [Treponema sp.]|uniref:TRAP transporter substrate-binding protein n=1 Tax=Treponema sp. TaxID=166 RepID=UPI00388D88E8
MNKLKFIFLCALPLLFASCNKKAETKAEPQTENTAKELSAAISLGFSTNLEDPRGKASLLFKEEVEKNSNGRIKIELYPDGKLGGDGELIEGVINGKVDMTVSSAGNFAVYATKLGISAMPFLFSNFDEAWAFMDGDLVSEVNKTLEEFGIIVLSHYDNGFRCVTTTNRNVKSVADMKGLNIRTPPNQIVMETMSALGASPKPYPFNELKKALKEGLFDSQENPIPVIYNSKLYEEQKYLSITNHSYDAMPLVIRKDLWNEFSDNDKQILLDAAKKAQDYDRQLVKEQTESYVSKLSEAGMVVTSPDLKEFKKATASVMDVFTNIYGEELLQKMKAAAAK